MIALMLAATGLAQGKAAPAAPAVPTPIPALQKQVEQARASIATSSHWDVASSWRVVAIYGWKPGKTAKDDAAAHEERRKTVEDGLRVVAEWLDHFDAIAPPPAGADLTVPTIKVFATEEELKQVVGTIFNGQIDVVRLLKLQSAGQFYGTDAWALARWYVNGWTGREPAIHWIVTAMNWKLATESKGSVGSKSKPFDDYHFKALQKPDAKDEVDSFFKLLPNVDGANLGHVSPVLGDFLARGPAKLGDKWQAEWSELLPHYFAALRTTKDEAEAYKKSFGAVDEKKLVAALKAWIKRGGV